jgi:hypothetical protein
MLGDIAKAKIVISNFHAFKRRETMDLSKVGRALLQGRGEAPQTIETEGQMLQRACGELMALKNVVVLNDEAHHCYREKALTDEEIELKGDDKEEAKKNNEAARLWISGIETLKRKVGVRAVYDLSATPFFLRGSGYAEGTLFPWTVSDFSLMDAIECGIVKLPRVPVADNLPGNEKSRSGLSARRPGHRHRQDSTLGRSLDRTDQQRCYLDPISLLRRLNRGQVNTRWKAARRLGVDGESEEAPGDVRAKSCGCKQPVEIGFDPPTGRKRAAVLATPQGATWRTQSLRHGWRDGRP